MPLRLVSLHRRKSENGQRARLQSPRLSTIELLSPRRKDYSVKGSSDPQRTGSVTAVNIKRSAIRVLSVTAAELRSQKPMFVESVWDTSSLLPRYHTFGISRVSPAEWDLFLIFHPECLRRFCTSQAI